MTNNDKICCWLSWNLFVRIGIFLFLLGIPFGIYKFEQITLYQLFSGIGVLIGFYLFYKRNVVFEKQLMQKDKQYSEESQFKNFLDSTKILTDKDSTSEAKIASLYLLYDTSKRHNDNVSRVMQIINKQISPLINCLENNCNKQKRTQKLVSTKKFSFPYKIENKYIYTYNDMLDIYDINDRKLKRIIKEWQYNGNDTEKLISVSLTILKKIFLKIEPHNQVDLSNTVLFDLDTDYEEDDIKIPKNKRPVENIIFLNCKLHKVNFSEVVYHQASFINCDLKDCDFKNAVLWGALFDNCNLQGVKFNNTECEATEFKKCNNLTLEQIKQMKFKYKDNEEYKNKRDKKEYLIILENGLEGLTEDKYFTTVDEFIKWRYESDKN